MSASSPIGPIPLIGILEIYLGLQFEYGLCLGFNETRFLNLINSVAVLEGTTRAYGNKNNQREHHTAAKFFHWTQDQQTVACSL